MHIEEARRILKENAKIAVQMYRMYTSVGFDYESPIALAKDVSFMLACPVVPPPEEDDEWDALWGVPF